MRCAHHPTEVAVRIPPRGTLRAKMDDPVIGTAKDRVPKAASLTQTWEDSERGNLQALPAEELPFLVPCSSCYQGRGVCPGHSRTAPQARAAAVALNNTACTKTGEGPPCGLWYGAGGGFGLRTIWRGRVGHTSNFGAGPSDAGNFNTPQLSKNAACFALEPSAQTSSTTTNFSLQSERDERT